MAQETDNATEQQNAYYDIQVTCKTAEDGIDEMECVRDYRHLPQEANRRPPGKKAKIRKVLDRVGLTVAEVTKGTENALRMVLETEDRIMSGETGNEYWRLLNDRKKAHKRREALVGNAKRFLKIAYIIAAYFLAVNLY